MLTSKKFSVSPVLLLATAW